MAHPVIFSSLELSVKMCKCLGYFSLTFSNSSWKISGQVSFFVEFTECEVYVWGLVMKKKGVGTPSCQLCCSHQLSE